MAVALIGYYFFVKLQELLLSGLELMNPHQTDDTAPTIRKTSTILS